VSRSASQTPRKPKREFRNSGQPVVAALLTPERKAELHRAAAERGVTASDLIRHGIDLVLVGTAGGEDAPVLNDEKEGARNGP
jgi:hypothetical protein